MKVAETSLILCLLLLIKSELPVVFTIGDIRHCYQLSVLVFKVNAFYN